MSGTSTSVLSHPLPVGPELVIGLVTPVGVDQAHLTSTLIDILSGLHYKSKIIRLASLLHAFPRYTHLATEPVDKYIREHQLAGNDFRHTTKRHDAMAILGMGEIQKERLAESGDKEKIIHRCAYIIRSLKNPEEVMRLRAVYGNAFFLIGASAPAQLRRRFLASRIAESHHEFQLDPFLPVAEQLIQYDQEEIGEEFGQNLRNAFHLADAFVDASEVNRLRDSLQRSMELLFGNTFLTPLRDEYGMFHARGAALRSAEPGRQVGAAISSSGGDIIAVGTNEVPKAGGGMYWAGDKPDYRQFQAGQDSNDRHKRSLMEDLLRRLKDEGWLHPSKVGMSTRALADLALDGESSPQVSEAQLTDLIEFGRAVHAELAAITDAARRGVSTLGMTMYVTTFPCHLCAPHIVASGISRVVYIEPYSKSLAAQLYPDSISVDSAGATSGTVSFEPFVGVAPRRYMDLFAALDRKKNGKIVRFSPSEALPRFEGSPRSYVQSEKVLLERLQTIIAAEHLMDVQLELPNVGS